MEQINEFDLKRQAVDREEARVTRMREALAGLPKRKSGEISRLTKRVQQIHEDLLAYDMMPDPPAVAGIAETFFDAVLARIEELKAAQQSEG